MPEKLKDGGPAFACAAENGHQPGMSIRDYFAGQTLAGIFVHGLIGYEEYADTRREQVDRVARDAYEIADAMLRAREAAHG